MGKRKIKIMVCEICGADTSHLERKDDHRHTRTCSKACKAALISKAKTVIDPISGLSRAKMAFDKASITKRNSIIDGKDTYFRASEKASATMAKAGTRAVATEKRLNKQKFDDTFRQKIKDGMAKIGSDGLSAAQRAGAKARETMIKSGHFVHPLLIPAFTKYQRKVHHLTRIQNLSGLLNFEKRGPVDKGGFHIDHKFSIKDGFLQGATPEEVSNIVNLEMLPALENIKKSIKSSWTLLELREAIRSQQASV